MDQPRFNGALAAVIRHHRTELAAAAVDRLYVLFPDLHGQYGPDGRNKCIDDVAFHVDHVASALGAASCAMLVDYLSWARSTMAAHGVAPEHSLAGVDALIDAFRRTGLPDRETSDHCAALLGQAMARLSSDIDAQAHGQWPAEPWAAVMNEYVACLLRRDTVGALEIVRNGDLPLQEVHLKVLRPALREVGRLWQAGEISVAQEHYCTATTRRFMDLLGADLFRKPRNGWRVMAASIAGDLHDVGVRMVSDWLEAEGWEVVNTGANTPVVSIVREVHESPPHLLAISVTMSFNVPNVAELIECLRREHPSRVPVIMVGGRAFDVEPELWRAVGADGTAAEPRAVVEKARDLTRLRYRGVVGQPRVAH